jgi:hypothetical protein
LQFDSSNLVTQFIKSSLVANGVVRVSDKDVKDWSQDKGEVAMKDLVAITSLAFLNKSNASGATPAVIEPRQAIVERMWHQICQISAFGEKRAKEAADLGDAYGGFDSHHDAGTDGPSS